MPAKKMQAKKNHHYVWAEYLKRWSKDGRDVCYVSESGKIAKDSVRGLAKERHFYQSRSLSPLQLEIIRLFSSKADANIQRGHTSILSKYLQIQRREELLSLLGNTDADARGALEVLNANFIENLHAIYENKAKPILHSLASKDISPLQDDDQLLRLSMFLGQQTTRTSVFKQQCLAVADSRVREDMEGCWWFLSYMFGVNIGSMIYKARSSLTFCLLVNETRTNFITSDHPIVNVHEGLDEDRISPPEKADLFYPISPKVALMANDSDRFASGLNNVDESFVLRMNDRISKASEKTIFGMTPEDIRPYRLNVGARLTMITRHSSSGSSER